MNLLHRLSIRVRLFLLAGVPVVGAVVLAIVIASDARQRAATAAALGSVEDLASLSAQMTATMFALQSERARAALFEGASPTDAAEAEADLRSQFPTTDRHRDELEKLLVGRELSNLPPRLRRELESARTAIGALAAFRERTLRRGASIDEILSFYRTIDESLIGATAGLSQLSEDGEILHNISALVGIAELSEGVSLEHALLANVAVRRQFAPGLFKTLVTLETEQAIYAEVFRNNASDDLVRRFDESEKTSEVLLARSLLEKTIASTDDAVELDRSIWFTTEQERLATLEAMARVATERLGIATAHKMSATRASIRLGVGLSLGVILISAVLALVIRNGVTRAIEGLATAAAAVQAGKTFSVRAPKMSNDELGTLADTFNQMLEGLEQRDNELNEHRQNLESLVRARTDELAKRNEAMRFVLDNVEQGLGMIRLDATLHAERSAKFDEIFGTSDPTMPFPQIIDPSGGAISTALEVGWETACEGILPFDVVLEQLPRRIQRGSRHLTLDFRPVARGGQFDGALLVVSDVTGESEARLEEEKQREYVAIFERVVQDREGFVIFAEETGELLTELGLASADLPRVMRLLHTIKGNASQWGVSSLAHLAHQLESEIVDTGNMPSGAQRAALTVAWRGVIDRLVGLVGTSGKESIELTRSELDDLLAAVRARLDHRALAEKVCRFYGEPVAQRFQRLEGDVARLAERLGKPKPEIVIDAGGVRLSSKRFGAFWSAMVHVVRNAIAHGLEAPEVRARLGKPEVGRITFRAREAGDRVTIECIDDGAGVDWARIHDKARAMGLPHATQADLEAALFASGLSTAREVTEISGRGVGLGAVLESCTALGGTVRVTSTEGGGTRCLFTFLAQTPPPYRRKTESEALSQSGAPHPCA